MARYRGTVRGMRDEVSRLGTKYSGLRTTANGWGVGVEVTLTEVNGDAVAEVWLTSGSSPSGKKKYIGGFTSNDLLPVE